MHHSFSLWRPLNLNAHSHTQKGSPISSAALSLTYGHALLAHLPWPPHSTSSTPVLLLHPPHSPTYSLFLSCDMTLISPLFSASRSIYSCCSAAGGGGVLIFASSYHLRRSPHSSLLLQPNNLPVHRHIQPRARLLYAPSATLSSFAEADNEGEQKQASQESSGSLLEMAEAFNISSATATAICICMAVATLTFPFALKSLGQGASLKIKSLSYVTLLFGFYMAWNIGANDVANAMGTSVGSGALTLPQAVLTAAVLEFSGALLMGTHVTSTMQKGILVASVFQGKDSLLFAGLLSSLAAAGTWLQV